MLNIVATIIMTDAQMKREKAVKRKEALEHAKREEEEARLAEVNIVNVNIVIVNIVIVIANIINSIINIIIISIGTFMNIFGSLERSQISLNVNDVPKSQCKFEKSAP